MIKLTSLSSCAGCASKLGPKDLENILSKLSPVEDPRLLIGSNTSDDAAVYQLDEERALVQTVDFFTPIVDDPYTYGQIAATNALSDVYAMGGTPLTALNIVGIPEDKVTPDVALEILKGGADKVKEAGALLVGGHSIRAQEPIYGLSVTGIVHPKKVLSNASAKEGDLLILTKPLGTGVITTAIKREKAAPDQVEEAVRSMTALNKVGHLLSERSLVNGMTDVTGFGLLSHLHEMTTASHLEAEIDFEAVPVMDGVFDLIRNGCVPGGTRSNFDHATDFVEWEDGFQDEEKLILADAQTSGGLLISVSKEKEKEVLDLLQKEGTLASAVIGRMDSGEGGRIRVKRHGK
ncbi:selenide, water dikinase SelD [candidate division TA06 bacterium]|nr:selenide, water dikinase SelD [candidate division TA06 bacterium]